MGSLGEDRTSHCEWLRHRRTPVVIRPNPIPPTGAGGSAREWVWEGMILYNLAHGPGYRPMAGDLQWYTTESTNKRLATPRCPFATADRCPRYYQSLSLMGDAGATRLDAKEDQRLLEKWRKSELWPRVAEQETAIFGPPDETHQFMNFCPEITYDRFGWFARSLARYADETDRGFAHAALSREHANAGDWRWSWSLMAPMHYSDCPLYSLLTRVKISHAEPDILVLKPGMWGVSIDLKALWRWITRRC